MAQTRDQVLDLTERTLRWAADQAQFPAFLDIRQDSEGVTFLTDDDPDNPQRWRLELVQLEGPVQ